MSAGLLSPGALDAMRDYARTVAVKDSRAVAAGRIDRVVDRLVLVGLQHAFRHTDYEDLAAEVGPSVDQAPDPVEAHRVRLLSTDAVVGRLVALATPKRSRLIALALRSQGGVAPFQSTGKARQASLFDEVRA